MDENFVNNSFNLNKETNDFAENKANEMNINLDKTQDLDNNSQLNNNLQTVFESTQQRDSLENANNFSIDANATVTEESTDNLNKSQKESKQNVENKYTLANFENPYELLLAIMEDKKVDLKTVVLSEITDEYLEFIRSAENVDWDQASEFLAVAATLLEIKVKALLPKPEEPKDDELDPEKELLRKIEEYKIMKEAAEELKAIEDVDRFYKEPDE